jgi:hypothetical protein
MSSLRRAWVRSDPRGIAHRKWSFDVRLGLGMFGRKDNDQP